MNFLVRGVQKEDLQPLFELAKQFSLLNLPPDKKSIKERIDKSIASFNFELPKDEALYFFVAEEIETGNIAGCSQVKTKHGTEKNPTYSFHLSKKERFSRDLGIGFIHQILKLKICTDGPTEIGGLVVDKSYRRRPEKVGKIVSLSRFMYIGMNMDRFSNELHSEMAPPLTDDGRSEFWEALGRRFTGMPYQEADAISAKNKEFIRSLFPEEEVYVCLLDAKARLVIGRVGSETMPALHMLESLGFKYKNEVDPFDGGPHLGVETKEVTLIKQSKFYELSSEDRPYESTGLVAVQKEGSFRCGRSAFSINNKQINLPESTQRVLNVNPGDKIFCYNT